MRKNEYDRKREDTVVILSRCLALSDDFRRLAPPVIVVGMHRSGTSMVAGLLHILGVYIDPARTQREYAGTISIPSNVSRRNGYGEARCFRLLNEEIMSMSGATWDNVLPFLAVRDQPQMVFKALQKIYTASHTSLEQEFLPDFPDSRRGRWGWKDPRNSLTLPYWLDVFPQAQILHVVRQSDGVASSLISRQKAILKQAAEEREDGLTRIGRVIRSPQLAVKAVQRRLTPHKSPFPTFSMVNREDCIRLAEIYVGECVRYRESDYSYHAVSYEAFIQTPERAVRELVSALGLHPSEEALQTAVQFICRPQ